MKEYKATKRNRNHWYQNFIGSYSVGINEEGSYILLSILNDISKNDIDLLEDIAEWIHDITSFKIHYNKDKQSKELLEKHYRDIGMPERLVNKIVSNLLK